MLIEGLFSDIGKGFGMQHVKIGSAYEDVPEIILK